MTDQSFFRSPLVLVSLGFVLGAFVASAWFFRGALPILGPNPLMATSTDFSGWRISPSPSGAVSVVDQTSGTSVLVDSVTVPPPGVWVAVEEFSSDGMLGNVLGATRVRAPSRDVIVELLRGTEPDRTYVIVFYRDNGDDAFSTDVDSVYVDFDTGERVEAPFRTFTR